MLVFWFCLILYLQNEVEEGIKAVAVITAVKGDVKIHRAGEKEFIPAHLEDGLFAGDSLRTDTDGQVTILYCNSGKLLSLTKGESIKIEVSPADTVVRGAPDETGLGQETKSILSPLFVFNAEGEKSGLKVLVRGEEDTLNIVVYKPGNSTLLTGRPDIVWSEFPDVQSYIVQLMKMGDVVWCRTTIDTILTYPEDEAELKPGFYFLKIAAIKDNDTVSTAERHIKVLSSDVINELHDILNNIKSQSPDPFTVHFLSAKIYEEKGLIGDAINEYRTLLEMDPDNPTLYRSLSILYNRYGLTGLGNRYLEQYEALLNGGK
ncbi:MAG TPA: hypothetical protein ENI34_09135 [candidate division WOR-3 bacterium]|uniref:Tetratricopeptide repeat protein n=1 Tax=candidate division WOR-3 bacterium TaxID=2052148 RepID=A0A9C9K153_UNCW3|nr:hypothetical protein [candidate division WOR-3 bacterium]